MKERTYSKRFNERLEITIAGDVEEEDAKRFHSFENTKHDCVA